MDDAGENAAQHTLPFSPRTIVKTRSIRGLMALVLAAAMALSTGGVGVVGALAAPPTSGNENITISISSQKQSDVNSASETYTAFRIFSVTKKDYDLGDTAKRENNTLEKASPSQLQKERPYDSGVAYFLDKDSPWKGIVSDPQVTKYLKFTRAADGSGWSVEWNDDSGSPTKGEDSAKALAGILSAKIQPNDSKNGYTVGGDALKSGNEGNDFVVLNTASGSTTATATVPSGYYLITSSLGANLILATTDIMIDEKNDYPSVTKKIVKDNTESTTQSFSIGDIVPFKIEVKVPQGSNNELVLHDAMSSGLTLRVNSFKVVISPGSADPKKDDNYKIQYNPGNDLKTDTQSYNIEGGYVSATSSAGTWNYLFANAESTTELKETIRITFMKDYITRLAQNNDATITITYDAILNDDASTDSTATNNGNSLQLTYSNFTTPIEKDTVYAYSFDLVKYYQDNNDTNSAVMHLLAGAKFKLYKADQVNDTDGKLIPTPTPIHFKTSKNSNEITTYKVDANNTSDTIELVSLGDGKLTIQGLKAGDYYLQEVESPAGYNMLDTLVKITIRETTDGTEGLLTGVPTVGSINGELKNDGKVGYNELKADKDFVSPIAAIVSSDNTYTGGGIGIVNRSGVELPSTGGIGTTIFYIVGGILVIGAGILLITKRRVRGK